MTVQAVKRWKSNAELIVDVAKLGYLDGRVLDLTYERGTFWKKYRPLNFTASDIVPELSPVGYSVDFRSPPPEFWANFDSVVLDPPYKLNGRPDPAVDGRYGVGVRTKMENRLELIRLGTVGAAACVAPEGFLLVKCMDQVCLHQMRWQTDIVRDAAEKLLFRKADRFDMIGHARKQPEGRTQRHAYGRGSTLLVFQREK